MTEDKEKYNINSNKIRVNLRKIDESFWLKFRAQALQLKLTASEHAENALREHYEKYKD